MADDADQINPMPPEDADRFWETWTSIAKATKLGPGYQPQPAQIMDLWVTEQRLKSDRQASSRLTLATWVLGGAAIALVLATVALVVVTAYSARNTAEASQRPMTPTIYLAPGLTRGQPKTLVGATAAAQEIAARYASRDYSGVWLLMNNNVRKGISSDDFVTLNKTCYAGWWDLPLKATGVRMDSDDTAVIRVEREGYASTRTMVYEDGGWVQAPPDTLTPLLGKPIDQMIAQEKAANRCTPLPGG
jgi:hypothetical protein